MLTADDIRAMPHAFDAAQDLLRGRLRSLLSSLANPLRADVTRALEEEGKLLSTMPTELSGTERATLAAPPAGAWSLLTLHVAEQLRPSIDPGYAASVAVATECYIAALDLLDDVEDADRTPVLLELGEARALNASTALLFLAQRALLSTAHLVELHQVLRLLGSLVDTSLRAVAGQHRDILSAGRLAAPEANERACMEIIAAKSASLMGLACRLGALCAGASDALCAQYARLGELLGLVHQLDNDCHDERVSVPAAVGDGPRGGKGADAGVSLKPTLPIVLARQIFQRQTRRGRIPLASTEEEVWGRALQEGLARTCGKALLYRAEICDVVAQLEAERPLSPALRLLLGLPAYGYAAGMLPGLAARKPACH